MYTSLEVYTCTRPSSSRHVCVEVQARTELKPCPRARPRAVSRRAVTHRDVDEAGIHAALQAARDVLGLR